MLFRLGRNAAAGFAMAGLAVIAAEGWRRACRAGAVPELDRRSRSAAPDADDGGLGMGGEPLADDPPPSRSGSDAPGAGGQ